MSARCRDGHEHESAWAADRCTPATRRRDVASIRLARRVKRAAREFDHHDVGLCGADCIPCREAAQAEDESRKDPFRGFRGER